MHFPTAFACSAGSHYLTHFTAVFSYIIRRSFHSRTIKTQKLFNLPQVTSENRNFQSRGKLTKGQEKNHIETIKFHWAPVIELRNPAWHISALTTGPHSLHTKHFFEHIDEIANVCSLSLTQIRLTNVHPVFFSSEEEAPGCRKWKWNLLAPWLTSHSETTLNNRKWHETCHQIKGHSGVTAVTWSELTSCIKKFKEQQHPGWS